jgi:transposase
VVEELAAAGLRPHLAEPTDTTTARGRKRRAKTDPGDAQWQRDLLIAGTLPESWIPPTQVLEVRTLVRLYVDLLGEHNEWRQRLQATLFHQGRPSHQQADRAAARLSRLVTGRPDAAITSQPDCEHRDKAGRLERNTTQAHRLAGDSR